jgi:hypothetical protein
MKSLPENEFWNAIRNRLGNYQEEPADDWDKIAGAIPTRNAGLTNLSRSSDTVAYVVLAFLLGFQVAHVGKSDFGIQSASLTELVDTKVKDEPKKEMQTGKIAGNDATPDTDSKEAGQVNEISVFRDDKTPNRKISVPSKRTVIKTVSSRDTTSSTDDTHDQSLAANLVQPSVALDTKEIESDRQNSAVVVQKDSVSELAIVRKDTSTVNSPPAPKKEKQRKKFRPSVYFQFTPSLGYAKIIPEKNDQVTIVKLNSPGILSADRFGWSAEAGFQMQVASKLELYASLSYYQQQQTISYDYLTDENSQVTPLDDPLSYGITPGTATREFTYSMRNTGASFGALYFLKGNRLMQKIGGGIFYQMGFRGKAAGDSYVNSQSDYGGYQLLYRMEYVLSRKVDDHISNRGANTFVSNRGINIFFQPVFTHSLFSNEKLNEPFRIKPYRAGLGFGLVYHF